MRTAAATLILLLIAPAAWAWNFDRHIIPPEEIQAGGPPRDGIPALTDPEFVTAREANAQLEKDEKVLGIFLDGVAKAYPIRILSWHELVNDRVGTRPILVSW